MYKTGIKSQEVLQRFPMTKSSFSLVPQDFLQADNQKLWCWQKKPIFLLLRSLLFWTHHCFDVLLHTLNRSKVRNTACRNTCFITFLLADPFLLLYYLSNTAVFETKPYGIWGPVKHRVSHIKMPWAEEAPAHWKNLLQKLPERPQSVWVTWVGKPQSIFRAFNFSDGMGM